MDEIGGIYFRNGVPTAQMEHSEAEVMRMGDEEGKAYFIKAVSFYLSTKVARLRAAKMRVKYWLQRKMPSLFGEEPSELETMIGKLQLIFGTGVPVYIWTPPSEWRRCTSVEEAREAVADGGELLPRSEEIAD